MSLHSELEAKFKAYHCNLLNFTELVQTVNAKIQEQHKELLDLINKLAAEARAEKRGT